MRFLYFLKFNVTFFISRHFFFHFVSALDNNHVKIVDILIDICVVNTDIT